jgi:uncharacterized protein
MRTVFADTFYFLAILSDRDQHHERAVEFTRSFHGRMITTTWVLTELGNQLRRGRDRERFLSFLAKLKSNPNVSIIPTDDALFDSGVEYFRMRPDKEWSLTDCISFVAMERIGITESLTGDFHFEQAGYHALLKQS